MNQMELKKKQIMIASRIFGLVMILLLANLIGDLGVTYFAAALEIYILLQLLFTAQLPDYVARFVRSRMAKEQYKSADMVLKAAVGYGVFIGIVGGLFLFAFSGVFMQKILGIQEATLALRFLAPAFFLNALCCVMQGYFQGIKTAVPTMVSAVIKEIFGILFASLLGLNFYKYGEKVSALLHDTKFSSLYGAEGAAIGVLAAAFLAVCFLVFIYLLVGRRIRRSKKEGMRRTENGLELIKLLLMAMAPVALLQFLLRVDVVIGMILFGKQWQGNVEGLGLYGAFYGKFLAIVGIVAVLGVLVTSTIEGNVVQAYKKEEYKNARDCLQRGMQAQFLLTVFCAGLFLTTSPVLLNTLFSDAGVAITCMNHGFLLMILIPMGLYFAHILVGIGKIKMVLITAGGSVFASTVAMIILQKAIKGNVLMLVYGKLIFAVLFCAITGTILLKIMHCNPEWLRLFVLPALAAGITGLGLLLIRNALSTLMTDIVTSIICFILGLFCYLVLIFLFRCIKKKDLYLIPGGKFLERIGNLLHIF